MTFVSETVRMLFHQLPTEKQVEYAKWEIRLAERQQSLQIEAVMQHGLCLEVVVRVSENTNDIT